MEATQQIQEILRQVNNDFAPEDRVEERELGEVSAQLNRMLGSAVEQANQQQHYCPPPPPTGFWARLGALWQAIKDKISAWLAPVTPRWVRMLNALRTRLEQLQQYAGGDQYGALLVMAAGIAIVAALLKSLPMLVALLAMLGVATVLRFLESLTRFPHHA